MSDGSRFEIDCEDMLLSCFKLRIAEMTGIVVRDQALFHEGRLLTEDAALSRWGVGRGGSLQLVVGGGTAAAMWPAIDARVLEHLRRPRGSRRALSRPASAPRLGPGGGPGAGPAASRGRAAPGAAVGGEAREVARRGGAEGAEAEAHSHAPAPPLDACDRNSQGSGQVAAKALRRAGSEPLLRVVPPFEERRPRLGPGGARPRGAGAGRRAWAPSGRQGALGASAAALGGARGAG